MKYLFLFLIAGVLYACSDDKQAGGHNHNSDSLKAAAMNDTANYTKIEWIDPIDQDLGRIAKGQMLEISWRFKNAGSRPLVINNVAAGCGCTVAEKPQEPIAPGKEGRISATFDSKSQHLGVNEKSLTVIANTQDKTAHYLTFKVDLTEK